MTDWIQKAKDMGFSTDGCTDSPDLNFGTCCDEHDFHYEDLDLTRFQADNKLAKCMWKRGLRGKLLAPIYWTAVRLFGSGHYERKQANAKQELLTAAANAAGSSTDGRGDFTGA